MNAKWEQNSYMGSPWNSPGKNAGMGRHSLLLYGKSLVGIMVSILSGSGAGAQPWEMSATPSLTPIPSISEG